MIFCQSVFYTKIQYHFYVYCTRPSLNTLYKMLATGNHFAYDGTKKLPYNTAVLFTIYTLSKNSSIKNNAAPAADASTL